jgi:uncharacterized membrane protein
VVVAARPRLRVEAIDLVRGLVMVIMALDHARDFFHNGRYDPTDLAHVSAALFFTRVITHLCAPTFMFLAGTSAFLSAASGTGSRWSQSRHLLIRGLWLVLLELTLVKFGWSLSLSFDSFGLLVIWALGGCFIALAGLIWLPRWGIALVGGAMVLLHNLTDRWNESGAPMPAWLWTLLHHPGEIALGKIHLYVLYPLIPWIGVMALGYAFGAWMLAAPEARRKRCLALGLGALTLFLLLRSGNYYGDSRPWSAPQGRPSWFAALAFVNTEKYPPSLLYLLMTLGVMSLLLAAAEGWTGREGLGGNAGRLRHALLIFGRVPLFFYVLHLPLLNGLAQLNRSIRVGPPPPGANPWEWGSRAAYDLPGVYAAWVLALLILYPLCARYDTYKRAHRGGWTRYV